MNLITLMLLIKFHLFGQSHAIRVPAKGDRIIVGPETKNVRLEARPMEFDEGRPVILYVEQVDRTIVVGKYTVQRRIRIIARKTNKYGELRIAEMPLD